MRKRKEHGCMRECERCHNRIPDKMRICPHCGVLPPSLWPRFYVYAVMTLVAIASAVLFRPFLNGMYIGEVSNGVLWAAFTVFVFFALIFICVCLVTAKDYSRRSFKEPVSKAERIRFINMKQHIESGRHFYEKGQYCTVCGRRKTRR